MKASRSVVEVSVVSAEVQMEAVVGEPNKYGAQMQSVACQPSFQARPPRGGNGDLRLHFNSGDRCVMNTLQHVRKK